MCQVPSYLTLHPLSGSWKLQAPAGNVIDGSWTDPSISGFSLAAFPRIHGCVSFKPGVGRQLIWVETVRIQNQNEVVGAGLLTNSPTPNLVTRFFFFVLRESFTSTKLRVLVSLLCTKPAVIHCQNNTKNGAQLGEHLTGKEKVLGSIPSTSWAECHGWFVTPALGKWRQETEFQRWLCLTVYEVWG